MKNFYTNGNIVIAVAMIHWIIYYGATLIIDAFNGYENL